MNHLRQATVLQAVVFFLVGIGCLSAAAYHFFEVSAFVRTAKTATGRVVDLEYHRGGRAGGVYVTVFTFADTAGVTHTARTSSPTHHLGDEVVVLYQPASPETARIRAFWIWSLPTILSGFGLAFSIVGVFVFVAARRTYRTTHDEDAT